jgi:hypothetical protein
MVNTLYSLSFQSAEEDYGSQSQQYNDGASFGQGYDVLVSTLLHSNPNNRTC